MLQRLEDNPAWGKVLAIDVRRPAGTLHKAQYHRVDLTLPAVDSELAALLQREQVDVVLHAAYLSRPAHNRSWAHELEVIGTMHVLDACATAGIRRLVVASSTGVYGAKASNPNFIPATREPGPTPEHSIWADRIEAERLVHRFAEDNPSTSVALLRTAPILGPSADNLVARLLRRPVVPVLLGYDPLLQFLYESDAADAFELALAGSQMGDFNIVADGVLPLWTVIALIGRIPLPVPYSVVYPIASALWATQLTRMPPELLDYLRFVCVADGDSARRELGFTPSYDIRSTLMELVGADMPYDSPWQLAEPVSAEEGTV
jgi:UDP-glucose 4-epimerase